MHCEAVQTFLDSRDNTGDKEFRVEQFPPAVLLGLVTKFSKDCADDEEFLTKVLPVSAALYAENAEDQDLFGWCWGMCVVQSLGPGVLRPVEDQVGCWI